jgi:hypothetical protein
MKNIDMDMLAFISGGSGGNQDPHKTPTTPTTTPTTTTPTTTPTTPTQGPSLMGNICRTGYTAVGSALGVAITSESGGWGGILGAMVGQGLGTTLCPP